MKRYQVTAYPIFLFTSAEGDPFACDQLLVGETFVVLETCGSAVNRRHRVLSGTKTGWLFMGHTSLRGMELK